MRPSWIAGVVATTLLLGLSACSGDEDEDEDDAPASPAAASPTASAHPTARGARSASFASCPTAASPSSRDRKSVV